MPYAPFLETKTLDQLLGSVVAQCNQAIAAGTTAQASLTIRGSAGSGNADHTPVVGEIWVVATPGSGAPVNQLTKWYRFICSGSPTSTSLTFASRTVVSVRAVGDVCFVLNTQTGPSAFGNVPWYSSLYWGLSTAGATGTIAAGSDLATLPTGTINVTTTAGAFPNSAGNVIIVTEKGEQEVAYTGFSSNQLTGCTGGTGTIDTGDLVYLVPTAATILAAEPTSAGSYARATTTNNAATYSAATGSYPASKTTAASIAWAASTAAYSSGATPLLIAFLVDTTTLAAGNILDWFYMTTPQTVNAASITPSIASGAYTKTLL